LVWHSHASRLASSRAGEADRASRGGATDPGHRMGGGGGSLSRVQLYRPHGGGGQGDVAAFHPGQETLPVDS
jgi:hypothetical protein